METEEKVKSTSMRLRPSTQEALKEVMSREGLTTTDETIRTLIAVASLGQAANKVPQRRQTLNEVQDLLRRLISKMEDNFDLIADTINESERKAADMETRFNAEIKELNEVIKSKEALIAIYKDALDRVGVDVKKRNNCPPDDNADKV